MGGQVCPCRLSTDRTGLPGHSGGGGRGRSERCFGYPLSALIVPLVWHLPRRRSADPYLANGLLVTPFVLDLLGNLVNLSDTVASLDDVLHFAKWTFLVTALVLLLERQRSARWNLVLLDAGFGALSTIV